MLFKLILHSKYDFPVSCKCFANAHPPFPSPPGPPEAIEPVPKDALCVFSRCSLGTVFTLPLRELKNPLVVLKPPFKVGSQLGRGFENQSISA